MVRQAQLLAHLQKQARRHAIAQQRIQQEQGVLVGMTLRNGAHPHHQLHLLNVAVNALDMKPRRQRLCRKGLLSRAALPLSAQRLRPGDNILMFNPSGDRQHTVLRTVKGLHERQHVLTGERPHGLARSGNITPERMPRVKKRHRRQPRHFVGHIQAGVNFFDDDGFFVFNIFLAHEGVHHHVEQDIQQALHMLERHLPPIVGHLARGVGVQHAANAFNRQHNIA